jgi:tetratricopeptide (TPR) repeat protein
MAMTEAEIEAHNRTYERAYALIEGEILVDGQPLSAKPSFFARRRLRKAITLFAEVLRINPENWAAMFGAAKAHQRLGDAARAFELMLEPHRGNPELSGFAREAALVAMEIGRLRDGIDLTRAAIRTRPDDGSLYSNLGLAHLLNSEAAAAVKAFEGALELEPDHPVTPRLLALARAVESGSVPCPRTEAEVILASRGVAV